LLQVKFAHTPSEKLQHLRKVTPVIGLMSGSSSSSPVALETQNRIFNESIMQQLHQQHLASHAIMQSVLQHQQLQAHQPHLAIDFQQQQQQSQPPQLPSLSSQVQQTFPLFHPPSPLAHIMNQLMTPNNASVASAYTTAPQQQLQSTPQVHPPQSLYDSRYSQSTPSYYAVSPSSHAPMPFSFAPPAAMAPTMSSYPTAPGRPSLSGLSKDARGPDGCNLFIHNLPFSYTEADLLSLFGPFGIILSAKVQRDRHTDASKGYGFVSYAEPHAAQLAIARWNDQPILGKKIAVRLKGVTSDAVHRSVHPPHSPPHPSSSVPSQPMSSAAPSDVAMSQLQVSQTTNLSPTNPSAFNRPQHATSPTMDQLMQQAIILVQLQHEQENAGAHLRPRTDYQQQLLLNNNLSSAFHSPPQMYHNLHLPPLHQQLQQLQLQQLPPPSSYQSDRSQF
jgi:hypothetical protein